MLSCEYTDTDQSCGCNTSSVTNYATHNNFLGHPYNGGLVYYTNDYNESAWYVGIKIPNTNYFGICKICNPNSPIVRAFTDTSSRQHVIPVLFSGKLRELCKNEPQNFGLYALPETAFFYITVDSLQK